VIEMPRAISEIKIKNFRQFHDIQIDFNNKMGKSNINVIIGGNRYGKTNLLNAIIWCMYGQEAILKELREGAEPGKHFVKNERYLDEETSVFMRLEDKNNEETIRIRRTDKDISITEKNQKLDKHNPEEHPEIKIKSILPTDVRKLFLFKGEFLDSFFEYKDRNHLKETILNVSQLNKLKKIIEILEFLEEKYRKDIQKKSRYDTDLGRLTKEIEEFEETIKRNKRELTTTDQKLKAYNERINKIRRDLGGLDEKHINELMATEGRLKKEKDEIKEERKGIRGEVIEIFFNELSPWLLSDSIQCLKEELNKLEKEGLLPPPVTPTLIDKILEERKCICGAPLNDTTEKELKRLRNKVTEQAPKLEELYKLSLSLDVSKEFDHVSKRIEELLTQNTTKEGRAINIDKQLQDISDELRDIKKADVNKLVTEKTTLEEEIEKLDAEKALILRDIGIFEAHRNALNIEFQRKAGKIEGSELLRKKMKLTSSLKEKVGDISNKILGEILKELNEKTKEYFNKIFWESADYAININENFEVEVISPEGYDMLRSNLLSTGEKKVLALSFMAALSDFYGFNFPIVIDAPFSALQKEVVLNMLDTLISLSSQKQVIIFTIPHEDQIMNELKKAATVVYQFDKDKQDDTIIKRIK